MRSPSGSRRQKPEPVVTANTAVFQDCRELAHAREVAGWRVERLERLYRADWKGAIDHLERVTRTSTPRADGDRDKDWY